MSRLAASVASILAFLLFAAILGASTASAQTEQAGRPPDLGVGSVNFVLAYKGLSGDWNLEGDSSRVYQPALGLELTWGKSDWPVHIALDVLHSYDDAIQHVPPFFTTPAYDVRLRASTLEVGLGARRAFDLMGWAPYLGAGGSWVRGNVAVEVSDPNAGQFGTATASAHARSSAFGWWVGGGLYRRIGPHFQIGASGRFSKAILPSQPLNVDFGTLPAGVTTLPELDGGGQTIQLVLGWSFPGR